MDISEAMRIFEIDSITEENVEKARKKYHKMMIKCHPDLADGSAGLAALLNEAMDLITETAKKPREPQPQASQPHTTPQSTPRGAQRQSKPKVIINTDTLFKILCGKKVTLTNEKNPKDSITLSSDTLSDFNVQILVRVDLDVDGKKYSYEDKFSLSEDNTYEIRCFYDIREYGERSHVKVDVYSRHFEYDLNSGPVLVKINYENKFTLRVILERQKAVEAR